MKKEFIYIILKLALSKGNSLSIQHKMKRYSTKIIKYINNKILIINPESDMQINDIINIEIEYNGTFKMLGKVTEIKETNITIELKKDFQYITKRQSFRLPLFYPIIINDEYKGIILDFNKNNYIAITSTENNFNIEDEIKIKLISVNDIIIKGKIEKIRDEIFNFKRYIIKFEDSENTDAINFFNKIISNYI
ncbi:hypothetical protein OF820_01880 [Oceanotoga sp. DSM 15011]|jgi:hypothetical protein|uniref:Uncharacterized protein n=1 Tax=Oceanotoga teriensis TaxID=515440 RepID=A0AA45C5D8_9BACT|nr:MULTISPECIES: hypothetical protein [Oceanotoga]MDN5342278.1 hypothetical protein [Oceanotoga sp.]MDO7977340.1 hypothetical protein [Oceanotoga teriensis]PWJ88731.1 hypothetical protein C7380_11721 [Oceanotoga teriensis]UYP00441.1 hypothetical protein OF820_01880 [Oceanotoga sp. DSM 15011]